MAQRSARNNSLGARVKRLAILLVAWALYSTYIWVQQCGIGFGPVLQWMMACSVPFSTTSDQMQRDVWLSRFAHVSDDEDEFGKDLEVTVIDVSEHETELLEAVEAQVGKDWKKKPLLLRNVWTAEQLADPSRKVTLEGMKKLNDFQVKYYNDTSLPGIDSLYPNAKGSIGDILQRIEEGANYKVGSAEILPKLPGSFQEIIPTRLEQLFGPHVSVGRYNSGLTKATVFVSRHPEGTRTCSKDSNNADDNGENDAKNDIDDGADPDRASTEQPSSRDSDEEPYPHTFTGFHSEPVSNVAVQLRGVRHWTVVDPKHSFQMLPGTAIDGRAYFQSFTDGYGYSHVPHYKIDTYPGDALFIPHWAYHRVDYYQPEEDAVSIGVAVFFLEPHYYFANNPIFGLVSIPAMIREAAGWYVY